MVFATSDVKLILGITSTAQDNQIGAMLYPTARFADEYCNFGLSHYVYHTTRGYVQLGATSTAPAWIRYDSGTTYASTDSAPFPWVSPDTVIVYSSDEGTEYVEDADYTIDYEYGKIYPAAGSTSGTSTGGYVLIDYAYIDLTGKCEPAKIAISYLIQGDINNAVGVASESAGPLSRSYFQNGIPPSVARMLKPLRRPVMR